MTPDRDASAAEQGAAARAEPEPAAIAIVGPTATGKTGLALEVARTLDGEVISADSRQAYRGMEIGTAAPTPEERAAVPHHGVAFLEPGERYGAGRFARLARGWMAEIRARGRVPLLVGGTGFFLAALLEPVFREPSMDEARRTALRRWLDARSEAELERWSRRLDPALIDRLERLDRQRAARTLEMALLTGRALSWWHRHGEPEAPPLHALVYRLTLPREEHRRRIARRADALLEAGWPEEASRLRDRVGLRERVGAGEEGSVARHGWDAIGYPEALAVSEGRMSREEASEQIFLATWAYARRQRTWFRHQLPEHTVVLDASRPTGQLARRIAADWRRETSERRGTPTA